MAGRFPLYTDADIRGSLIRALIDRGWDVVRAVDAFPEKTADRVHFEHAARQGRVLVTNDEDQQVIAAWWLAEGRPFRGVITWPQAYYGRMTVGDIVRAFDELTDEDDPFGRYPIIHIEPKSAY